MYWRLKLKTDELLRIARENGLGCALYCATRSFEEQARLYARGRTVTGYIINPSEVVTNARPGYSWHNYGLAVDIVFQPDGEWSWHNNHDWEKLGEIGESLGLSWGGRWVSFYDRPHFQLTNGVSIQAAFNQYVQFKTVQSVWELVDKNDKTKTEKTQSSI